MEAFLAAMAADAPQVVCRRDGPSSVWLASPEAYRLRASVWSWYGVYIAELGPSIVLEFLKVVACPDKTRRIAQLVSRKYGLFCLSKEVRIQGLPSVLPEKLFVSVHHRWTATPLDYQVIFAFLSQYDEIHVAIGLNTKRLRQFGLSALFRNAFGAIDLTAFDASSDKYDAIQSAMATSVGSCAVVVFPDIAGSTHWGDRTMTARNGLFAASAHLAVPILDLVHIEPGTPVYTTIDATLWSPPALPKTTASFAEWRRVYQKDIEAYRDTVHEAYVTKVDALESQWDTCEDSAQCAVRDEAEITHNMTRNMKAGAYGSKM